MRSATVGLACLAAGYTLSQFYRAFLAVLAPTLQAEVGAGAGDLAIASGLWYLGFAAAQLPIGWALDAVGPRRTTALLLAGGAGVGAAVFATAQAPWHLYLAMALIGVGCAPVLMSAYFVAARGWPAARFGALAGLVVAVGSAGDILGASPLVAATQAFGWRATLWGVVAATFAVAAAVMALVRDPAPVPRPAAGGALRAVLATRGLWTILPLVFFVYAAPAAVRGVWAAPYLAEVHGADARAIGRATLVMGLATIAGNLLVGPAVRAAGGLRRAAACGTAMTLMALGALAAWPAAPWPLAVALLGVLGLSGANYAMTMAHGRAFLPPHLLGYGMTLLNMTSILGVAAMQFATRPIYRLPASGPGETFTRLFLAFALPLGAGLLLYLRSADEARG